MAYTVKVVADIAGISVRTLHHYDEIDLLKPAEVSPSGYRLYSDSNLETLQQILFFKELGFNLQEIKTIMQSPDYDQREALLLHRQMLLEKQKRIEELIKAVEKTLETLGGGITMSKKEMFDAFDESTLEKYKQEAREKYPQATVDECERRTSGYSKQDWNSITAEGDELTRQIAERMEHEPGDAGVQELVRKYHQYINDKFYTCTAEIFSGLADLYLQDERFTAYYEKYRPGLAQFMHDAMKIYVARLAE